ncbi:pleckstrin homology domain-containing family A member 7 isoform X2 [Astyanax mexicanus]|uniref:pleckstrin homology domain-containing family A member 7 isoform X2 n=1 Tax=Astyanax mexicanus TaxID=7994 RepID=UPI0020CAE7B0|nr:pleckstrin homology domain-containing family A member 7 isoform X2 [Astyanax mexicanus]
MGEAAPGSADRERGIMAAPLRRDTLPQGWSYGVCRDGRVFFIDDEARATTWLHPLSGEPVNSGHMLRSDLPPGWEEGFTREGASFFIDHNQRTTSFRHPVTGQLSSENGEFRLQTESLSGRMLKPQTALRPDSTVSETSTTVTSSTVDTTAVSKSQGSRLSGRVHSFGKRDNAIKRNPNVPVVLRGWLHKQDGSGMRLWRRKWFVLADYCLFYYKDSREENVLGSIPLPSYTISPVGPEDHISRKYAFKASHTGMRSYIYKHSSVIGSQAEHGGMRTYYFSADTQEDMNTWLRAMNQAALMQNHTVKSVLDESDCSDQHCTHVKLEEQAVPQINHINSYVLFHAEAPQSEGTETLKQELLIEEEKSRTAVPEMEEERGKSLPVRPREVELSAPDLAAPSQSTSHPPSRAASTLPASFRNGESQDMNGMVGYQRGPTPRSDTPTHTQGSRSTLEQVENWVKGQKREHKGSVSGEETLSRRTPPAQTSSGTVEAYQSVPNSHQQLPSDYRYAQDRLSQLRAAQGRSPQPATREGTVWQLYEWQQRQQYRHASPTAPIYVPAPDYSTAVSSTRANPDTARSVSVPPLITSAPAPGPPGLRLLSPRRPHTPAERLTVKPQEERPVVEVPPSSSPRRIYSQKYATVERRSIPPSGYITHTVSAPSLHRKTPEELTLLLIQLRRHQAVMAGVRSQTLAHLQQLSRVQADDTYVQLKKDLEYLDLKMAANDTQKGRSARAVKVAESDVDVKLSRLCEQDKTLQELEIKLSTLKEDKDKLESVLDVAHQQMEQYQDQPIHTEKIAYQQRLLQEDLVHIRADISRVATEMERAWAEYGRLEQSVERLREALQTQMNLCTVPQEKSQLKRELWRIEDVMAGLSSTKDAFKITVDSVQNPERKLVPSVTELPSSSVTPAEICKPQHSPTLSPRSLPSEHSEQPLTVPKWAEDTAPPRPPLPLHYDEDTPPAVPPLPKETSIIRHTSVRGLKRQSDERKRDRESSFVNGDGREELRSYLSEPELPGSKLMSVHLSDETEGGYLTLPNRGLSGSLFRLNQSTVSSYSTLRRDPSMMEKPKSALEQLYSTEPRQLPQRGRMSVEEQLERMKRHQRALVRERKRNINQGERQTSSSRSSSRTVCSDLGPMSESTVLKAGHQTAERTGEKETTPPTGSQKPGEWLRVLARPVELQDLEHEDIDLELDRETVPIPKCLQDTQHEEPLIYNKGEESTHSVK